MHQLFNIISENVSSTKECKRLFHGRGKKWEEFSHLSIDYYPPTILITTYKEIGEEEKRSLVDLLSSVSNLPFDSLVLQKRYLRSDNIEILKGEAPSNSYAYEREEKYILNLSTPQNIGFFLDMGHGREWLRKNAKGKKVLNLFSYTCSLSVAALKGEALEVINVDMSRPALNVGEKNHRQNNVGAAKFIHYDIMKSFGNITKKGPYDLVIIDPPTNQGASFKVERDYHKIIRRLPEMTNEGAIVMACLNSPYLGSDFLISAFKEFAPMFHFEEKLYSSFSDMEANPEEGLKILFFRKA